MSERINYKEWDWGRYQWASEIGCLTKEGAEEFEKIKREHPNVDFEKLACEVRSGRLKPVAKRRPK